MKMSTHMHSHEKSSKSARPARGTNSNAATGSNSNSHSHSKRDTANSSSNVIAAPPRAALSTGQTRTKDLSSPDNASIKSSADSTHTPSKNSSPHTSEDVDAADLDEVGKQRRRIEELEREVKTMEEEFEKELTTLSLKLTNESETALFWQQKHTHLHQLFLKIDTELKLLRAEAAQQEARDREVKTRISSLMLDRDAFREAYNEAMGEVGRKEEVLGVLRGQVRGLKSWVVRGGRAGEDQVSDEVLGESVVRLANGLQNWVIVHFRRVRIVTETASDDVKEKLLRLIPTYDTLATSSKIHFIQSLVSRLLLELIFDAYFVGIPKEQAEQLENIEKYLSTFGPVENINQWRSTTLSLLRKEATEKLQAETGATVESIVHEINTIMESVSDVQPSDSRDQSLRTLIHSSIDLSRLLRAQKAIFAVVMPLIEGHQQTMFDPETMEDIGGEDEDTLTEREIRCVTFPGLVKAGDENGERGYLKNVVAKIRVLCAPD